MMVKIESSTHPYLEGGGEMGALTRSYDWSKTPIGPVDQWPQSLRTTVSIILRSDFPMFLWWGEEMIQFYNDAYRPSMGHEGKHPTALGQRGVECWPEIWPIIYPLIQQVRHTGESFFIEDKLVPIYRNGKIEDVYWTFSYSAVIGEHGNIDGILVVCHETTKQVFSKLENARIRKQLELSEQNLRNIILQAPVAMCLLMGKDLAIEIANEKILEIWGKDAHVIGKPVFDALPEARSQGLEAILERVIATGEHFIAHERRVNLPKNGRVEQKFLNFVYEPFYAGDGSITGIMAVAVDVSEQVLVRRKIEDVVQERTQALAESNAHLQRSNEELRQFAYIASHDLQEPARKIRIYSELLLRNLGKIDERSQGFFSKIDTSSARMLELIRDVLSFSQLANFQPHYDKINLSEILVKVKSDFELLIEEKGAVIEGPNLPVISGIRIQIIQLFSNLISNSLKFSLKNFKPVIRIFARKLTQVEVNERSLSSKFDYQMISFQDNGIGFEQENATQIFDIFQRLHSKAEYEGTGIGLAMCKKIARNHHGDIFATSSPGNGAIFHVILPEST